MVNTSFGNVVTCHLLTQNVVTCHLLTQNIITCHLLTQNAITCHLLTQNVITCHLTQNLKVQFIPHEEHRVAITDVKK